jgi:mono/diheme cytochrome c family protein
MKRTIKISFLIIALVVSIALLDNSCTWKKEKDMVKPAVVDTTHTTDTSKTKVTYTKDIAPIFSQYCISCHSPGGVEPQVDYTNYNNVKLYTESGNVMDRISRDNGDPLLMPQGGPRLPQATIDKIQAWINGGYLQ